MAVALGDTDTDDDEDRVADALVVRDGEMEAEADVVAEGLCAEQPVVAERKTVPAGHGEQAVVAPARLNE